MMGLMEDSLLSVILITLQNAVQHFVHKERRALLAAGWLELFNLAMSFNITGNK